jgi:hypothetical protein
MAVRLAAHHIDNLGVVSTAIAGNRLLFNSAGPTGPDRRWGQSVLARFDRDMLGQAGPRLAIVWLGLNDLAGAGAFYPAAEAASADGVIARSGTRSAQPLDSHFAAPAAQAVESMRSNRIGYT